MKMQIDQLATSLHDAILPSAQLNLRDVAFDTTQAPHTPLGVHLPWHGQSVGTGPTFFRTDLTLHEKLTPSSPESSDGTHCFPNCINLATPYSVDLLMPKVRKARQVPNHSPHPATSLGHGLYHLGIGHPSVP